MMQIELANGAIKSFPLHISVAELAQSISPSLARAAIAARVNGELVDTSFVLSQDSSVEILTAKDSDGLAVIRHSAAHLLAYAVKELFPDAKVAKGPVTENGFYYDFSYKRPFTPDDLEAIESKMLQLSKKDEQIVRKEISRSDALDLFHSKDEIFKEELINSIPENQKISVYSNGNFIDLCKGPHVPSVGKIKVFKLMKLAGAYWRGNSDNEMLQRIYGTAWENKEDQDAFILSLEEAERRDHRKLGKSLDLFHFQDEAPGLVFWHPKGWTIWQAVEQYMRNKYILNGYDEVKAPQILDVSLWKKTGHWENYRENMFTTEAENRSYAVKPMNCPGHVQIFNSGLRSYRELPVRYGEFGQCHRNEPSGSLHGLMRVRGFTQDDGHIFCTEEQVASEVFDFHAQAMEVYRDFGFNNVDIKLALRPSKRIGSDEIWDQAENSLRDALRRCNVEWTELPGEGAFYGPKIEYHLKDSLGRPWQVGTMQVDFSMPGRLGAEYVDEDNRRKIPVMLHRAIVGSMERFIGMLIEHYAGAMPLWLAPIQVSVLPISQKHCEYAEEIRKKLRHVGLRVHVDSRNVKVNLKIREHSIQKVPYLLIVGDNEVANGNVSVRARKNPDTGNMDVENLIFNLKKEITEKN